VARVKDVLDDEEWKIKPLSLLLASCAGILGVMIVTNALGHHRAQHVAVANTAFTGNPQQASAAPPEGTSTIVLKYDPLIEDVQRELLAAGVYKGSVDGVNGLRTKQAIQAYQQANGLPATGEASEDLVNHIRFTRKVQQAAQFTGSVDEAGSSVSSASTPVAKAAPAPVTQAAAQDANVKKVQVALAGLGYGISKLDGHENDETRAAILKYEMDNGLDMGGMVDEGLMKALKLK
jgi:peptidoglycan hydrolase-like protein with peptidoglycan-binding domain